MRLLAIGEVMAEIRQKRLVRLWLKYVKSDVKHQMLVTVFL